MPSLDDLLKTTYALDTTKIVEGVSKLNFSDEQKSILAATILLEQLGGRQRRFSFKQDLAEREADCGAQFQRSFVHADWQDGEDVVSAEGSNGDEGFNARFHKIEADLDSLARDASKAFECLMELRQQLSTMMGEIKVELNQINADLFALKPSSGDNSVLPPVIFEPVQPIKPKWWEQIGKYVSQQETVGRPPIDPRVITGLGGLTTTIPSVYQPLVLPGSDITAGVQTVWTQRGNEGIGMIGNLPAKRIGEGVFNNQRVEMWNTSYGMLMTPLAVQDGQPGQFVDPRLELAGRMGAWVAANRGSLVEKLGADTFTKEQLVQSFGDSEIGSGVTVRDVLRDMPAATEFSNVDALTDRTAALQAEAIRKTGADTVAVVGAIGLNPGDTAPQDTSVDRFSVLNAQEKEALKGAGINTMSDLAQTPPDKLTTLLAGAGNDGTAALDLAGRVKGMAGALVVLGGRMR